ncbi:MAG: hypothetical protein WBY94_06135 [Polyangiaceae bacterium]
MAASEFPRARERRAPNRSTRRIAAVVAVTCMGLGMVASCSGGSDNTGGGDNNSNGPDATASSSGNNNSSGNNSSGNNSGGNNSSGNNSSGNNSSGNNSSGNNSSGNNSSGNNSSGNNSSGNNSSGNNSSGNNSSGGSSSGNGSGGNGGNNSSGNNSSGGSSSGNGSGGNSGGNGGGNGSSSSSGSGGGADSGGGGGCTNSDMTLINEDSSGIACNNQWGITGAWYCFADTSGTSSCPGGTAGNGVIPYNKMNNAMCLSGTTASGMPSATAYGAAIGLELNHVNPDAGPKSPYNAKAKGIVGFAITISGDSGGSILNVNFPPAQSSTGEAPGVTLPGVATGSSPITYNVLFSDAIMSDNSATPIPKVVDPTNVTDVQLKIDVDGIAHAYNFCITKIVPLTAAPAAPGSQTALGPTFNEGKQIVVTGLGPYGVQNDPFNVGSDPMTMSVTYGGGQVGFTATSNFTSSSTTPGAFPSVAYGWIHGGNFVGGADSAAYTTAKTIGSLASVTSSWSFTAGSGSWDAAYDCWLGSNSDSINPGSELMVWLAHATVNPIGGQNTATTIAGATGSWTYSTGTNGTGQPVVSYVSTTSMTSVSNFDLLPFMKDAASNGRASLSTGSYLLGCQAGFELYNPGTWKTNSYSMSIK